MNIDIPECLLTDDMTGLQFSALIELCSMFPHQRVKTLAAVARQVGPGPYKVTKTLAGILSKDTPDTHPSHRTWTVKKALAFADTSHTEIAFQYWITGRWYQ